MTGNTQSALGERQRLMKICANATATELQAAVQPFEAAVCAVDIRPPQTGLVMMQARTGGSGNAFNIGEATVTRAAVRLEGGITGHACMLGRSRERARLAAILDALGQDAANVPLLERVLVEPVTGRLEREAAVRRTETAATKVDFFTLVRGEDS